MFGKMTRGWARKRYVKEAKELVDHLQELDDESIGLVLAIAVHHRNILISEGAAMRDLTQLVKDAPMYQHDVAKAVGILARKKATSRRAWFAGVGAFTARSGGPQPVYAGCAGLA